MLLLLRGPIKRANTPSYQGRPAVNEPGVKLNQVRTGVAQAQGRFRRIDSTDSDDREAGPEPYP